MNKLERMNSYSELLSISRDEIDNCVICLDEIYDRYTTKCNHDFCKKCIKQWVKENDCCPLCRLDDILIRCDKCKKDKEINLNNYCEDCQIKVTSEKFEKHILIKLEEHRLREWKKLPLWKRIKIKTKLKCKKILKNSLKIGKIIGKNIIIIPFNIIKFALGLSKRENKFSYNISLVSIYIYIAFFWCPPMSILAIIFGVLAGINAIQAISLIPDNRNNNRNDEVVDGLEDPFLNEN